MTLEDQTAQAMPLILVIESDRRQTSKLSILARNQLHADLLIVDNVTQALEKLEECDPELILTSPLMSGRDQLALGDRLLELEEEGLRIQTVTIPQLGMAGQRARIAQKGAPGRAPVQRGRPSQGDSIDPVVFGMQLATLLDRIANERAASPSVVRQRQTAVIEVDEPETIEEAIEEEPATVEPPRSMEPPRSNNSPDWSELLEAMRREIELAQSSSQPQVEEPEHRKLTADFPALTASSQPAPVESGPAASAAETPEAPAEPAPASATPARKTKKVRRVPPQDEFGFFDPRQCGLSALYAKLDTIAPPGKSGTPKKPS